MLNRTLTELRARSYASWQAPGSTLIRVSSLVMDGIYTEVMKEFNSVAGRGPEAGGILVGRRTENEIVVDDYKPVLCEYRFGPSFRLSDSDLIGLRDTLEDLGKHEDLSIVGWYRTDTRPEFALGEEDSESLDNQLQPDSDVTLLITPGRSQPYGVKLFFREDGRLQEAPQTTRFPFDRPVSSLRDLPTEQPVAGRPTARTLSWIEQQLLNPTIDPESIDPGSGHTAREVPQVASSEPQEPRYPSAASAAARELEDAASTAYVERKPEPPLIQPASGYEEPTATVMPEAETVSVTGPPVLAAAAPKLRAEFEHIGPLARKSLFAEQPLQERKRRKWVFMIGALLFTAIAGTLSYFSVRLRPTVPASTPQGKQVPASSTENQIVPAPRPDPASPKQPAATASTVQAPSPNENSPAARDTDRQVRIFLRKWVDAEKSTSISDLTDLYAPELNSYFTKQGVSRAVVRSARELDNAKYGRMIVCDIKDITVKAIDSGHVVATFRKHWQTAGPSVLMGEEQDELTLVLAQGEWQIAAEKRIKLYRVRKEHYVPASRRRGAQPIEP